MRALRRNADHQQGRSDQARTAGCQSQSGSKHRGPRTKKDSLHPACHVRPRLALHLRRIRNETPFAAGGVQLKPDPITLMPRDIHHPTVCTPVSAHPPVARHGTQSVSHGCHGQFGATVPGTLPIQRISQALGTHTPGVDRACLTMPSPITPKKGISTSKATVLPSPEERRPR